jgi:hypothetical protein
MSDWTWEYVPDAANVVGGLTPAQIDEVECHIFAMKALAARTRDVDDLRLLGEMIGWNPPQRPFRYAQSSSRTRLSRPGPPPFSRNSLADGRTLSGR